MRRIIVAIHLFACTFTGALAAADPSPPLVIRTSLSSMARARLLGLT